LLWDGRTGFDFRLYSDFSLAECEALIASFSHVYGESFPGVSTAYKFNVDNKNMDRPVHLDLASGFGVGSTARSVWEVVAAAL
jgi:hypothetical protein